jgi:arginyl-tRNA synthetase
MFQPLTAQVEAILRDAFAALNLPSEHARAVISGRPELADLQCNGAMPAANAVRGNPRAIASDIKDIISARPEFAEVSVAGPGFLNMRLSPALVARTATEMGRDESLGIADEGRGRIAIVDFGGPNVAKPLHVGHLRSLVIGESLRRILQAQAWRVVADAHLGDWGLQAC